MPKRFYKSLLVCLALAVFLGSFLMPPKAGAVTQLLQNRSGVGDAQTSVSLSYSSAVKTGTLLVVVCAASEAITINGPSGFSIAIRQAATPAQAIFYKISAGTESNMTCSGGSANAHWGIQIYEYAGVDRASPFHAANSATGSNDTVSSGSVTTTRAKSLLIAAAAVGGAPNFSSGWTDFFTGRADMVNGGLALARHRFGGADRSITGAGTFSTTIDVSITAGNWRGQVAAFNMEDATLTADIVDAAGALVASPSVAMQAATASFVCGSVTGTLGETAQQIRIRNYTGSPAWSLAIAPTAGTTGAWTAGTLKYDFNDSGGSPAGCSDSADSDTFAGRLTIDPSASSMTYPAGCSTTGISKGSSAGFSEGSIDSITLLSANTSSLYNCHWDVTNIGLTQTIPAEQQAGSYVLSMTLTLMAS